MKKISILVPCYNEEENVELMSEKLIELFESEELLKKYNYEIIFIDNCSKDKTRDLLAKICSANKKIKAILNTKNFGQFSSPYYGMLQTSGDCTILLCADFQDPLDMLPKFVAEWENGYKIVCGIKTQSKESSLIYCLRSIYYKMIKKMSEVEQIEHFTGFGLYDRSFIEVMRKLDDPTPFLRGIVAELGPERKEIPYCQPKRRAGKTHNNWYSLYDAAMLSFTSYTKIGLRAATILGFICGILSFIVALVYLILKLIFWNEFSIGLAPSLLGVFFLGAIQLFFLGLIGEYILNINKRIMKRPLVVEEKRLNFDEEDAKDISRINSSEN